MSHCKIWKTRCTKGCLDSQELVGAVGEIPTSPTFGLWFSTICSRPRGEQCIVSLNVYDSSDTHRTTKIKARRCDSFFS